MTDMQNTSGPEIDLSPYERNLISAMTPHLPPIPHDDCEVCDTFKRRSVVPTHQDWNEAHRLWKEVWVAKLYDEAFEGVYTNDHR